MTEPPCIDEVRLRGLTFFMFLVSGEVTENVKSDLSEKKYIILKMLEICRIIDYSMIRCWQKKIIYVICSIGGK